jgi:hypothetical protein
LHVWLLSLNKCTWNKRHLNHVFQPTFIGHQPLLLLIYSPCRWRYLGTDGK